MRNVLIIAIMGLLFASCEKDKDDYRDDFVGTYECSYKEFLYGDTIAGVDTFVVGKVYKSMLNFRYMPGDYYHYGPMESYIKVEVNHRGEFSLISSWNYLDAVEGRFYSDSIVMNVIHKTNWGEHKTVIKGKKI